MSRVFSIELDGMVKACSAKVIMNSPVTSTMAMEAINSEVVSFGFSGFCAFSAFYDFSAPSALLGAVFTIFFVAAKWALPYALKGRTFRKSFTTRSEEHTSELQSLRHL